MNVSPSSQETSKNPFSNSLASGEVMDRMQGVLPGSSNTKPSIDTEMKIEKPSSIAVATDAVKTAAKNSTHGIKNGSISPSNDLKKLAAAVVATEEAVQSASADADSNNDSEGDKATNESGELESQSGAENCSQKTDVVTPTDPINASQAEQSASVDKKSSNADPAVAEKAEQPKKKPRKRWKKPADKPPRPLSAYNLFFKRERGLMLGDAAEKIDQEHGKKRVHRKTHGKIGFAEMARIIGAKWKKLAEEEKKEFMVVAKQEKEKYAELLAEWREEKKKQSIASSMAARNGKKGSGKDSDDDTDSLLQTINEDREMLLKRHSAFRMQMKMYEEMALSRLARDGRSMPGLDYMRSMPDDRSYYGGRMAQYPNAAEDSGRNILQHMLTLTGHEGPGHMSPRTMDSPMGPPVGNSMGTMGGAMGGSMGNTMGMNSPMGNQRNSPMGSSMGNHTGHQMGHPMGHPMSHSMPHSTRDNMNGPMGPMDSPMGNNSMGNTMGGMVPVNNAGRPMSNSSHPPPYEMDRYPHMRMHGPMMGMNGNHMPPPGRHSPTRHNGSRGSPDMGSMEGHNDNMDGGMMRRYHHHPPSRYHHGGSM
mmetsp:Transcript_34250/g.80700  ORF Transcript_34250/g.80700 Transcript_34250/m.80700 type:complete len:591 (+) Transcript_34250:215-1987(+)